MRNLKKEFEATFKDGEPLYDPLEDYWHGVSGEGDLGYVWKDKPHRLVFQLIAAVVWERKQLDMVRERAEKAEAEAKQLREELSHSMARAEKAEAEVEQWKLLAEKRHKVGLELIDRLEMAEKALATVEREMPILTRPMKYGYAEIGKAAERIKQALAGKGE